MKVFFFPGWSFKKGIFSEIISKLNIESKIFPWDKYLSNTGKKEIISELRSVDEPILCGWSLGGYFCQELVSLTPVKHCILISCGGSFVKSQFNNYGTSEKVINLMITSLESQPELTLTSFFRKATYPNKLDIDNFRAKTLLDISSPNLIKGLNYLVNYRYKKRKLDCKIQIIQGNKDRIFNKKGTSFLKKELNCQIEILEEAGHLIPLTHSKIVAKNINKILTDGKKK
jgi:pimeloyl-ACP methyl ester carboxylesterase